MVEIASYEYIIIGAGSAGCVLAYRLGERPENNILVLEAGGKDHFWNWKIHMPAAFAYPLADDKVNWHYHTEPEPFMDGRRMYCPRGRVLGGSSSINGMVLHPRPRPRLRPLGAGRPARLVLRATSCPTSAAPRITSSGGDDYHGGDGPAACRARQDAAIRSTRRGSRPASRRAIR